MMEELSELKEIDRSHGLILSEINLNETSFATVITISRPEVKNALDLQTMRGLAEYVDKITLKPSAHRTAVVLHGAGDSFISGGDLKALHHLRDTSIAREMSSLMRQSLEKLRDLSGLFVVAAEGPIIGGGAEVFIAGDYRIISSAARLRFAQSSLGLSTGWGGGRRLAQLVGKSKALALLLEGETLSATECQRLGLAHQLISKPDHLLAETFQWLSQQSQHPQALYGIKRMLRDDDHQEVDQLEAELFPSLWSSEDHWRAIDERRARKTTHISERSKTQSTPQHNDDLSISSKADLSAADDTPPRGLFVVYEGIDGAGTTTQAERTVEWFNQQGRAAYLTQEPSRGIIGTLTRRALSGEMLGHGHRALPAESIALLFAADRADHWHNEIEPRLERGEDVICDRYLYSSLAYQGLELPESWVRSLNSLFPQPDILLYVEVTPKVAAQRRDKRGLAADRYEVDELQVQIAQRYSTICREFDAHWVNGDLSIDEVTTACIDILSPLLEMGHHIQS